MRRKAVKISQDWIVSLIGRRITNPKRGHLELRPAAGIVPVVTALVHIDVCCNAVWRKDNNAKDACRWMLHREKFLVILTMCEPQSAIVMDEQS